jgi:hypothetical protein
MNVGSKNLYSLQIISAKILSSSQVLNYLSGHSLVYLNKARLKYNSFTYMHAIFVEQVENAICYTSGISYLVIFFKKKKDSFLYLCHTFVNIILFLFLYLHS